MQYQRMSFISDPTLRMEATPDAVAAESQGVKTAVVLGEVGAGALLSTRCQGRASPAWRGFRALDACTWMLRVCRLERGTRRCCRCEPGRAWQSLASFDDPAGVSLASLGDLLLVRSDESVKIGKIEIQGMLVRRAGSTKGGLTWFFLVCPWTASAMYTLITFGYNFD